MEKENVKPSTKTALPPTMIQRRKLNARIVKLSDLEPGEKVVGKYLGQSERPWLDKETGEEKIITQFLFEESGSDARFMVFGDAGFKNTFSSAGVTKDDVIEIEKLEMKDLGGGRRVNQYDIYQLS